MGLVINEAMANALPIVPTNDNNQLAKTTNIILEDDVLKESMSYNNIEKLHIIMTKKLRKLIFFFLINITICAEKVKNLSKKLVSTIITTFKRPDTLDRAIKSVLDQTYSEIEVIVVDDNDEESKFRRETSDLMGKYENDNRVIYLKHKRNMNGAMARNTGLKKYRGDYVTFLDDDDFFHKERFEKLIPLLGSTTANTGVILSGYQFFRNNKKYRTGKTTQSAEPLRDLMYSNFEIGSGSNIVLKRTVIDKVKGFDVKFKRHQDLEFLVRVADNFNFITVDDILLNIQVDSNTQNKTSIENMIETKKQFVSKYNYLIEKHHLDREKVILNNMRDIIYLITYYDEENEFEGFINEYIHNLSYVEEVKFKYWQIKIKSKNKIRKIIFSE